MYTDRNILFAMTYNNIVLRRIIIIGTHIYENNDRSVNISGTKYVETICKH